MKTAKILRKSVLTPGKSWITLLNSAKIIKKNAVTPVNFHLYHYASNNPVRYTDPDGRNSGFKHPEWEKIEDKHISENFSFNGVSRTGLSCTTTHNRTIDHYRTSYSGDFNGIKVSFSGTKDVITISDANPIFRNEWECTLIRLNVDYDGKNYDFIAVYVKNQKRVCLIPIPREPSVSKSSILIEDLFNDSESIYKGKFYRGDVEDWLVQKGIKDIQLFGLENIKLDGIQGAAAEMMKFFVGKEIYDLNKQYDSEGNEEIKRVINFILAED